MRRLLAYQVRGKRWFTPPASAAVQPPAWVPRPARAWLRGLPAFRRGRFYGAVQPSPAPPLALSTRRARSQLPARRGIRFAVPVPPPVAGGTQALPPQFIRPAGSSPRWAPLPRRGRYEQIPLVGFTPAPPTLPPAYVVTRRPPARLVRRGRYTPFLAPLPVPVRPGSRRPQALLSRRGRYATLPPAQPTAPPYPPQPTLARRRPPATPTRRGCYIEPPWPQATAPAFSVGVLAGTTAAAGLSTAGDTGHLTATSAAGGPR